MPKENFKKLLDEYGLGNFSREKEIGEVEYVSGRKKLAVSSGWELDVHGQRVGVALLNIGVFLDDCQKSGVEKVTIITGKGTGVLRQAVKELLEKNKEGWEIKNFELILDSWGEVGGFEVIL